MKIRNFISVFFLALYLTTVFSSVLPYIEYMVNYDYISTVLCINKEVKESTCHGKCHLSKQIGKTIQDKIPVENENSKELTLTEFDPVIVNENEIKIDAPYRLIGFLLSKNKLLSKGFINSLYRPPTSIC